MAVLVIKNAEIMKRYVLFVVIALLGCSKSEEPENKLNWVKAEISFDQPDVNGKGPEGKLFLFSLNGKHPKELKPYVVSTSTTSICYIKDVNNEEIFSNYQRSFTSYKNSSTGLYENKSIITVYSYEISPYIEEGEYLLVLYFYTPKMKYQIGGSVFTGGHTIAYKKVKFSNNSAIVYNNVFQIAPQLDPSSSDVFGYNTLLIQW